MELTINTAAQKEQLSGIREFTYLVRANPGSRAAALVRRGRGESKEGTGDA